MDQVLFFIGVIYQPLRISPAQIIEILTKNIASPGITSKSFSFYHTAFYAPEMGEGLQRFFISLNNLGSPLELTVYKNHARRLEQTFFNENGKRYVNLDPGYLDSVKLILASNKFGGHKIAISEGIYADMVLDYFKGQWRAFDWSFPDFKSGEYFEYFSELRKSYLLFKQQ